MKHILPTLLLAPLFALNFLSAQTTLIVPQATDGGGWSFVLVITNTTTAEATVSVSFFKDSDTSGDTEAWTPVPLEESVNLAALSVPAGSSVFLHSTGTAANLTQGWAQITNAVGVQAYIVYTYINGQSTQEATAQGVVATAGVLVPFENVGSFGTELAIVNPTQTAETISANVGVGSSVTQNTFNIPAGGHIAVVTATDSRFSPTAGQRGLLELYVSSGTIAVIALRSDTNSTTNAFSFTTAPAYSEGSELLTPTTTSGGGGSGGGGGGIPSGDITFAGFSIGKTTLISSTGNTETDTAGGAFEAFTAQNWNLPYSGTKVGNCLVYTVSYSLTGTFPNLVGEFLNAGNSLSLKGPSLPTADQTINMTSTQYGPTYAASPMAAGTLQDGGTYTLTGTGGTQVQSFQVSATLPSGFSTNLNTITSVNRSQPLPLTWSGTGFETVIMTVSGLAINSTNFQDTILTCVAAASLGAYSIPSQALSYLPAVSTPGFGTVSMTTSLAAAGSISSQSAEVTSFTPGLVSGGKIKYGAFSPFDAVSTSVTIQ